MNSQRCLVSPCASVVFWRHCKLTASKRYHLQCIEATKGVTTTYLFPSCVGRLRCRMTRTEQP